MERSIKWSIVWRLPDSPKKIKTEYETKVPKGITPSYYLWVATGRRMSYKNHCFIYNMFKGERGYVFRNHL